MTRLYYDLNRSTGQARGILALTDERALDLLLHGFELEPLGWSIAELLKEVAKP